MENITYSVLYEPITIALMWDTDRADNGDLIYYVSALSVTGTRADGSAIALHYKNEPESDTIDFWRSLAMFHDWVWDYDNPPLE